VVKEVSREVEVVGSIPNGHEARVATQWSLPGFKKPSFVIFGNKFVGAALYLVGATSKTPL
jgi:hypothetical protein